MNPTEKILIEALDCKDISSVRNILACMAEGEGPDYLVYTQMAGAALEKLDQALAQFREAQENTNHPVVKAAALKVIDEMSKLTPEEFQRRVDEHHAAQSPQPQEMTGEELAKHAWVERRAREYYVEKQQEKFSLHDLLDEAYEAGLRSRADDGLVNMRRVNGAIWDAVMEGTAWCGWKDRARDELVKSVQESVAWALDAKQESVDDGRVKACDDGKPHRPRPLAAYLHQPWDKVKWDCWRCHTPLQMSWIALDSAHQAKEGG